MSGWITPSFQNITVALISPFSDLPGNIALDSGVGQGFPLGLGGSAELDGFNFYFYVDSVAVAEGAQVGPMPQVLWTPPPRGVPAPIAGDGLPGMLLAALLIFLVWRRVSVAAVATPTSEATLEARPFA
jgi:hypothetical protein